MGARLPEGTVTFLFTDIEGSTRLLNELGPDGYAAALGKHRRIIRDAIASTGGVEVDTQGDAFFAVFPSAPAAVEAAREITDAFADDALRVRIGIHTGTPSLTDEGYVGYDVHRAARIAGVAHGGQVVISSATAGLVGAGELRDLGDHRLKDLSAPERIYQLGGADFPPLTSLHSTNLPVPATPFLGRERELADVVRLLTEGSARIVTLVGPGGTGKTRLALQAAAEAAERFPDGMTWVPLAPLRDASLVLPVVAEALGVGEAAGGSLAERVGETFSGKRALLLIDNAEHLLPEAAGEFATLSAAGAAMLVTSRERLRIQGEQLYPVPTLTETDGVSLFVTRARALEPAFEGNGELTELCARLDFLPLALELAAARTNLFTPRQLLERLSGRLDLQSGARDTDDRQQTLRATIEWSFDLLDSDEQRLFRRLACFAGGCTYDAAEAVCEATPETLQSLIDKSLVRRRDEKSEPRYWMLETIREFAAERLEASGEAHAVRQRHAEWACELVERDGGMWVAERGLGVRFGRLHAEAANVRAALAWAWGADSELALRFGPACSGYWIDNGLFRDAVSWLEQAARTTADADSPLRLTALDAGGEIAFYVLADTERADGLWAQAMNLAQELGDDDAFARAERRRTGAAWERGDVELALEQHRTQLAAAREEGDRGREATLLHWVGEALRDLRRFDEAKTALLQAEAIYQELEYEAAVASNVHSLGDLELDRGDLDAAAEYYRQALAFEVRHGRGRATAYCLAGLASVLADRGRYEDAARLWGAVSAAEETLGFRMLAAERRRYERRLSALEGSAAWREGRELALDQVAALVTAAFD
jgi:predicted ATPase/class 3 adenylate cyclase